MTLTGVSSPLGVAAGSCCFPGRAMDAEPEGTEEGPMLLQRESLLLALLRFKCVGVLRLIRDRTGWLHEVPLWCMSSRTGYGEP